jgi:hypothetical protein
LVAASERAYYSASSSAQDAVRSIGVSGEHYRAEKNTLFGFWTAVRFDRMTTLSDEFIEEA